MKHELEILYEDSHIIVCFKPHGLATQSGRAGAPDLEHMILNHLAEAKKPASGRAKPPYLAVIHRLDQPVAGILVFAKTPQAAKNLNQQLTKEGFGKHYLALVDGVPPTSEGTLTDYMVKDGRTNASRICERDTPGAKQARLSYRVLPDAPSQPGQTLLEVTLDTGRHHQIRVQLAHMGFPIAGDTKYNPKAAGADGWQTIRLCAYKLTFRHPATRKIMNYKMEDRI